MFLLIFKIMKYKVSEINYIFLDVKIFSLFLLPLSLSEMIM